MTSELIELQRDAYRAGVPLLFVKGPLLAWQLYGDLAGRESADLDILIREADLPAVTRLLAAHGYRSPWAERPEWEAMRLRTLRQLPFHHPVLPWQVEVHCSLLDGPGAGATTFEALASEQTTVEVSGETFAVLRPATLLLYLCAHGAKHIWERLGWVADVARLLEMSAGPSWESLVEQARRRHWERALEIGVWLAADLLEARLPAGTPPPSARARGLARNAVAAWSLPSYPTLRRAGSRLAWHWQSQDCLGHRLWTAWNLLGRSTEHEWTLMSLPRQGEVCYLPLRITRLACKYLALPRRAPAESDSRW